MVPTNNSKSRHAFSGRAGRAVRRRAAVGLAFFLFTAPLFPAVSPAGEPESARGRIIHVIPLSDASKAKENENPTSLIVRGLAEALKTSQEGDTLILAAGEYEENVVIPHAGLEITAPKGREASIPVTIVGKGAGPTIIDRYNTRWRGISFVGSTTGSAALLDASNSHFEQCRFSVKSDGPGRSTLKIAGGRPVFHACIFHGEGGRAMDLEDAGEAARGKTMADFTYCIIEGFHDGLTSISGDMNARYANCVITDNGRLVTRATVHRGIVEIVNSVLYFNHSSEIANPLPGSSPVKVSHCIYTPTFNNRLWLMGLLPENQPEVELINSKMRSPRFRNVGRPILVNLCIDDTRNITTWNEVTEVADDYGYGVTIAVNTTQATEELWEILRNGLARGHEIGSHSSSHTPVMVSNPVSVGLFQRGMRQARLSIDASKVLTVSVDNETILTQPLNVDGLTVNALGRLLSRAGLRVKTGSYYGAVPARFLSKVTDLDIGFATPSVPLEMDSVDFLTFELNESRRALRRNLPELREIVFLHPFSVSSPLAKELLSSAGYFASRSNISVETSGVEDDAPDTAVINIYGFPGYSLATAGHLIKSNAFMENVRLILDWSRRFAPTLFFYTHGYDEFNLDQWQALFEMLDDETGVEVLSVAQIAERIKEMGKGKNDSVYVVQMPEPTFDYRPRPGSPLIEGGMALGLDVDFAGKKLPEDKAPNIGLFQ